MRELLSHLHDLSLPVGCGREGSKLLEQDTHDKLSISLTWSAEGILISDVNILDFDLNVVYDFGHKFVNRRGVLLDQALRTLAEDLVLLKLALISLLVSAHFYLLLPVFELPGLHEGEQICDLNDQWVVEHVPHRNLQVHDAQLPELQREG